MARKRKRRNRAAAAKAAARNASKERQGGSRPAAPGRAPATGQPADRGRTPASGQPPSTQWRTATAWAAVLTLLIAAAWHPVLWAEFIWDDSIFLGAEPVRAGLAGFWRIWFQPGSLSEEGHYWPLVYSSLWLDHKLWGFQNPGGFHATNLLLHYINCLLLWALLLRLAAPGAWLAAALFALHPAHVEAVAWVIARKDLLAAFFYFSAILAWLRYSKAAGAWSYASTNGNMSARAVADSSAAGQPMRFYWLALALFLAGMMSKTTAVTLPAVLAVLQWRANGRIASRDWLRLAPFFAVGLTVTLADFAWYSGREPLPFSHTPVERLLIAAQALWFYAGKLLWPGGLAGVYPRWDLQAANWLAWAAVAGGLALLAALWLLRERVGRGPMAAALGFALALSPVLGFVDYGYMQFSYVADRYQYLASAALLALFAAGATLGARRLSSGWARRAAAGGGAILLATLGVLTWKHTLVFEDEVSFFSHVVARNPVARGAHVNLAQALGKRGRLDEALAAAREAVALDPGSASARGNLSLVLKNMGRLDESLEAARATLRLEKPNADRHGNVGLILMQMGREEEAVAHFRQALDLDPRHLSTLQNLAEWHRANKRANEAIKLYREVLALHPDYALAHAGIAELLYRQGMLAEALQAVERAIALRPEQGFLPSLLLLRGWILQARGDTDAAIATFERAIALNPQLQLARDALEALRARPKSSQPR